MSGHERQSLKVLMGEIWARKKNIIFDRILVLEEASTALQSGSLSAEKRELAASEAHRLAGSLGTLGFPEGSRISQSMEGLLELDRVLDCEDGKHLASLVKKLREELSD